MPRVRLKINSWDRKILIGDEAKVLLRAESWRGSFRVSMETVFPISSVSLLLLSLSIYLHAHTLFLSLSFLHQCHSSLLLFQFLYIPFLLFPVFLSSLSLSRAWGFHTVSAATLVSTDAPPPRGGAPRARPTTPLETDLTLLRHYPSFPYYAVSYYRYYYYYCRAPFDS